MHDTSVSSPIPELTRAQRYIVLLAAFLGWMFAGMEINLFVLIHSPAMTDVLASPSALSPAQTASTDAAAPRPSPGHEAAVKQWFAWYQAAFLFGAASGGWILGLVGDRFGRTRALSLSILCYSLFTGACYWADDPYELLVLRFLACHGIGGAWPSTVALIAEAWPDASRPFLAGLLGTAANVGQVLMASLGILFDITPTSWRWVLLVGAAPGIIGLWSWWGVPESVRWLKSRLQGAGNAASPLAELFGSELRSRTLLGISLAAIPVIGTAANAQWIVPWAEQVAKQQAQSTPTLATATGSSGAKAALRKPDPKAKAWAAISRSSGAVVGSLLGGILATLWGRRITYFTISLLSLAASTLVFGYLDPLHPWFHLATFIFGVVGTVYFGWLPLFLPELFPTRVRASGTGISFNSGRIVAGCVTLGTGVLLNLFGGNYAQIGVWTGFIYAAGMIVILFAPGNAQGRLKE